MEIQSFQTSATRIKVNSHLPLQFTRVSTSEPITDSRGAPTVWTVSHTEAHRAPKPPQLELPQSGPWVLRDYTLPPCFRFTEPGFSGTGSRLPTCCWGFQGKGHTPHYQHLQEQEWQRTCRDLRAAAGPSPAAGMSSPISPSLLHEEGAKVLFLSSILWKRKHAENGHVIRSGGSASERQRQYQTPTCRTCRSHGFSMPAEGRLHMAYWSLS